MGIHIRKTSRWRLVSTGSLWIIWSILFMGIPAIIAFCLIYYTSYVDILVLWFISIFFIIWCCSLWNSLKIMKVKRYKENWMWVVKTLKITWIEEYHAKNFIGYYVEANDWEIIYCSDAYSKWKIWWTSLEYLEKIYKKYWFEFDEEETHRQDVLREIDNHIREKEWEISSNGWFLRNISTKFSLSFDKWDKKIVEGWYQPKYWEVNWDRITVWDTVTVYVDPDNPKNYWMDIDFLFDK